MGLLGYTLPGEMKWKKNLSMPDMRGTKDQSKDFKLQLGEKLSFIAVTYGKTDPKQYHKKHPKQQQQQQTKNHSLAPVKKQEAWSTLHSLQALP